MLGSNSLTNVMIATKDVTGMFGISEAVTHGNSTVTVKVDYGRGVRIITR
jgi:hypothetical protein